jgi:hypothetical protein
VDTSEVCERVGSSPNSVARATCNESAFNYLQPRRSCVHERSIASCRMALRQPQSRTEFANRAIGSSAESPPDHYLA